MKKFWIQALKADDLANGEHPETSDKWQTLREGTSPANLLAQFVQDVNDDFSEFKNEPNVRSHYFRLRERDVTPAICHNCNREFMDEDYKDGCAFCCPKCRG